MRNQMIKLGVLLLALAWSGTALAAVTFQAAGTAASGTGAVSPAWPAYTTNDIALLFVESTGGQAATLSTPAGFVAVTNSPQATGATTSGTRITVFWARATSAAMTAPTVANPGDHVYARILTYRGAITTGNPWDITGGGVKATASTSVTVTGVTTTVPYTLIVQAVARDNDSTAAAFSAETNANLANITERSDAGTTSGNGGGFAVWDGTMAAAGATGNTTATVTSSINAFLTIALKPVSGAGLVISNPSTCSNLTGVGTVAWTNPLNATVSDNAYATASNVIRSTTTNYLNCTGFNFSAVPAGSTITGITVFVERKTSGGTIRDSLVYMIKGGVVSTLYNGKTATAYTTTDVNEAHGGPANLWGTTWTVADVQAANFGVAFAAYNTSTFSNTNRTVSVDVIQVEVDYTAPAPPDHIRIEHNGGACSGASAPAQITLKACNDAACSTLYTVTSVTGINLAPAGAGYTWTPANPQTISGGINSAITLARSTAGTATLAITGTPSPAPLGGYECYNTNSGVSGDCNLVFSTDSFTYNVPDHASATRQVVTLTSCKGTFANKTRAVKFWSTYNNPATGTLQGNVVAGTGNANCVTGYSALGTSSASPTTLSLVFSNTTVPVATFSLCYPDVGDVKLDTRYDGTVANGDSGAVILGTDTFIAKPAGFTLSNIKRSSDNFANPGAADAGGIAFVKAGEAFTATVTAVNASGAATPNYGKETSPESVKLTPALVAGLGLTNYPAVSGSFGAFASGVATDAAFKWDEVGIITLTPSVGDADYLGAGDVTGTPSGKVGRFSLGKFDLQNVAFDDRADLCQGGLLVADGVTPCASTFTYMGEEIDANFTLVPMSLNDVVVQNYVDSAIAANDFAKLDPSTFANLNLAAVDRTTAGGPYYLTARIFNAAMPVASCATALCFQSGSADVTAPFTLSRDVAPDGAYGAVEVGIAPVDSDGARVEGAGATPGLCNNPNAADCYDLDSDATAGNDRALLAATEFRYGRMKLSNAHGSELLPLSIAVTAQYWNGTTYVTNTLDDLTSFPATLGVTGVSDSNYLKNLASGETVVITPPASVAFVNGVAGFRLSAPGAGNNGSVDMAVNAPSYLPSNTARATFGVYKGNQEFVYMRENY